MKLPPLSSPRALLLDFDGVTIDSELLRFRAWKAIFGRLDIEIDEEEWLTYWFEQLLAEQPRSPLNDLVPPELDLSAARRAILESDFTRTFGLMISEAQVQPDAARWIRDSAKSGVEVGVVTNNTAENVMSFLRRAGLDDSIGFICGRTHGIPRKPSPALYLSALSQLNLHPNQVIVVEDSPHGVRAAKRAGLFTVGQTSSTTGFLSLGEADVVIPQPCGLGLEELLSLCIAASVSNCNDCSD